MRLTDAAQLQQLWADLEVPRGAVVMCHSFLASLGRLTPGPEIVVETLLDRLGPEGTLVAPAFTYSYFNGATYDPNASPSTVGVLGDLVRMAPGAVRSLDPNFSMAAIGAQARRLMARESLYSFGPESIYQKLMDADLWLLLIGVDFTAVSLFMHLERMAGVAYRYEKRFDGVTVVGGELHADSAYHFVRDEKMAVISHRQPVGSLIEEHSSCRSRTLAYGVHRLVPASLVQETVLSCLRRDPYFLVQFPIPTEAGAR